MNKPKAPKIPPLKVDHHFVMNREEKAKLFNEHFSNQCKPSINDSTLPAFTSLTNIFLSNIRFYDADILFF